MMIKRAHGTYNREAQYIKAESFAILLTIAFPLRDLFFRNLFENVRQRIEIQKPMLCASK